jgi:hypothetical protein
MKTLFVARSGVGVSFRLYTKASNGRHAEMNFGTGTLSGGKVKINVVSPNLAGNVEYDTPLEAIAAATKEGFALVSV